jgi:hypothetical protein
MMFGILTNNNTMAEIVREPLPDIPKDWDVIKTPPVGMHGYSYSHFRLDECSSAMQKAIRRCLMEAYQWALEMFYVNKHLRTNVWNRLLVISLEDVGCAHPEMVCLVHELMGDKDNAMALAKAVSLLVNCKKSRVNDWGYHAPKVTKEDVNIPIPSLLETYTKALTEKNAMTCMYITRLLWKMSEEGKKIEKDLLKENKESVRDNNILNLHWMAFRKAGIKGPYVRELRNISRMNNWRWSDKSNLIYCQIIHLHCFDRLPAKVLDASGTFDEKTLGKIVDDHKNRVNLVGMPDHALDKHTGRGMRMGRGFQHFLDVGGVLNNECLIWKPINDYYVSIIVA